MYMQGCVQPHDVHASVCTHAGTYVPLAFSVVELSLLGVW